MKHRAKNKSDGSLNATCHQHESSCSRSNSVMTFTAFERLQQRVQPPQRLITWRCFITEWGYFHPRLRVAAARWARRSGTWVGSGFMGTLCFSLLTNSLAHAGGKVAERQRMDVDGERKRESDPRINIEWLRGRTSLQIREVERGKYSVSDERRAECSHQKSKHVEFIKRDRNVPRLLSAYLSRHSCWM